MKDPNKHGIVKLKCKLQANSWRNVILFRFLQSKIRRQAIAHKNKCKNMDTNARIMEKCECHLIE